MIAAIAVCGTSAEGSDEDRDGGDDDPNGDNNPAMHYGELHFTDDSRPRQTASACASVLIPPTKAVQPA